MSDMKCPFCGEKIEHIEDGWCNCKNRCTGSGSIELWLQFLRTRKALEIAWDGLKKIGSGDVIEHSVVGHEDDNKIFIANKDLVESKTALEQKDVK